MDWRYCGSLRALKKLGSFKSVKDKINGDLENISSINARGWNELFDKITSLRALYLSEPKKVDGDFISESNKYIFVLLYTSGKIRLDFLEVCINHYKDKSVAKRWRNKVLKAIHPDVCSDSRSEAATKALNDIYNEMVQ